MVSCMSGTSIRAYSMPYGPCGRVLTGGFLPSRSGARSVNSNEVMACWAMTGRQRVRTKCSWDSLPR